MLLLGSQTHCEASKLNSTKNAANFLYKNRGFTDKFKQFIDTS